jgi:DNA-binding CsgD family transcriptional regulator
MISPELREGGRYPHVKRGRLSPDEMAIVDEMADRGRSPGQIALRLNRHPATINYAMHRLGHRKLTRRTNTYVRNGKVVKPFSEREDALILSLRTQGYKVAEIADAVTATFDHPRTPHTINTRLVMLASAAEAA